MTEIKAKDIVCIKTTGEKVYVIAEKTTDGRNMLVVRRPNVAENGAVHHEVEEFFPGELESINDFADRAVGEMKLKARKQKDLLREEMLITEEVEKEVAKATGIKIEPDPIN